MHTRLKPEALLVKFVSNHNLAASPIAPNSKVATVGMRPKFDPAAGCIAAFDRPEDAG